MNIKEFYETTKPKLKGQDQILIYAFEILPSGDEITHHISLPYDLKKYPKLNDIEIIRTHNYKARFSNCDFNGKETNNGLLNQYCAIIDYNEMRKAKGFKPIKETEPKNNKKAITKKKKRFTL